MRESEHSAKKDPQNVIDVLVGGFNLFEKY